MQKISLIDETFDLNYTSEYILSIQVSLDGFSFSILNTAQNKVVYLCHQDIFATEPDFQYKKLKSIYKESDLLELPYKKTRLYFSIPEKTTLVPVKLFKTDTATELYGLTFGLDKQTEVQSRYLPCLDAFAVFGIQKSILGILQEKHPGIEIQNAIKLSACFANDDKQTLKVSVLRKHLMILSVHTGLHYYNCFYHENENDMLFYILAAAKSLDEEPSTIIMDGMVNKHSEIYHRLRQYFADVQIAGSNKNIGYSHLIERLPDARFVNLFNSFSCE